MPVTTTTAVRTIPRYKLSSGGSSYVDACDTKSPVHCHLRNLDPTYSPKNIGNVGHSSQHQQVIPDTWIPYAKKQRIAPSQSRRANPPKRFLQNFTWNGRVWESIQTKKPLFDWIISTRTNSSELTHSGVVGGGVNLFGPSLARFAFACKGLFWIWIFLNTCLYVQGVPKKVTPYTCLFIVFSTVSHFCFEFFSQTFAYIFMFYVFFASAFGNDLTWVGFCLLFSSWPQLMFVYCWPELMLSRSPSWCRTAGIVLQLTPGHIQHNDIIIIFNIVSSLYTIVLQLTPGHIQWTQYVSGAWRQTKNLFMWPW